jgi:predicted flavoprotein YhiN
MDELFAIIGRLYADLNNSQKIMDMLQEQLKSKDQEILELKKPKLTNE